MADQNTTMTAGAATTGLLAHFDIVAVVLLLFTLIVFLIPVFILFPPIPVERSDVLRQTHSKLGLRAHQSNLQKQQKQQHASTHKSKPGQSPTVQSLFIYPVKSCKGIELVRSKILSSGLEYDRLYTFAILRDANPAEKDTATATAAPTWEFQTQRQLPLLANVKADLWLPDTNKKSRQLGFVEDAFLVLRFPWSDGGVRGLIQWVVAKMSRGLQGVPEKEFMLPLDFPSQEDIKSRGYEYANVKIWKDFTSALNLQKEVPAELTRYLGVKHTLGVFRMDPSKQREVFRCAPRKETVGYQPVVDFHDAYPLHILSLSSIQDLENKVQKDATMSRLDARRFRANIIFSGADEYDEETWKIIRVKDDVKLQDCQFDVSCRTVRCKLPNVDPVTGIRHKEEPDHALRKFRDVDEGAPKMGCLGMQMCPIFPNVETSERLETFIEVGMNIEVLQRGDHRYMKQ